MAVNDGDSNYYGQYLSQNVSDKLPCVCITTLSLGTASHASISGRQETFFLLLERELIPRYEDGLHYFIFKYSATTQCNKCSAKFVVRQF